MSLREQLWCATFQVRSAIDSRARHDHHRRSSAHRAPPPTAHRPRFCRRRVRSDLTDNPLRCPLPDVCGETFAECPAECARCDDAVDGAFCSAHGECEPSTGACACDDGWSGVDCSTPTCAQCVSNLSLALPVWAS